MRDRQSSITASGIAVVRAVESEKVEGVRICYDPYAARFLNPWFYRSMRFFIDTGYAELTGPGVLGFLVARCRYMDDLLQASLEKGLEQLVILGAGYDSRAYRFDNLTKGVKVYEVDHPATQQVKMKKVKTMNCLRISKDAHSRFMPNWVHGSRSNSGRIHGAACTKSCRTNRWTLIWSRL